MRAARAAYVGGCAGTSNVLAGYLYGVPIAGTAAHSWTQVFPTERESFEALLETFPDTAILLIDTYNPLVGAQTAASLGRYVRGVRLDSGDLLTKSREVREILDRNGLRRTMIFASGDLNEYKIAELVSAAAPIDVFGVGTELATSRDVPALSVVYKLVEVERDGKVEYKTKFSENKAHWPGRKQVFRFTRNAHQDSTAGGIRGEYHHDLIARAEETYPDAIPLLVPAMREGSRLPPSRSIHEARERAIRSLDLLPMRYQQAIDGPRYPVSISPALERLLDEVKARYLVRPGASATTTAHDEHGETERLVFLDVDTQVDFMYATGALYVPGAEAIIANLKRLMTYAQENLIPVLSSADAHSPDDPSFAQWPPHCVIGTPGQKRIPETHLPSRMVIPNRPGAFTPPGNWAGQFEIEKTDYSVAGNPNFESIMAALGPCRFGVFGVATEYCVLHSALALRKLNVPVHLVVDAIRPITEQGGREAIAEMVSAGVRLVTTEEICSGALRSWAIAGAGKQ